METDNIIQLVGIAVTAAVAWWTLKTTFANERKKRKEEDAEKVNSFVGALRTEVNTLWPIYMQQYGSQIEGLKAADLPGQFPVGEGYFTVYESNAHLIGHISYLDYATRLSARTLLQMAWWIPSVFTMNYWVKR